MLISIITINFNNKSGLLKTIESVVNQTYKSIEYIVIDGGSTDGSKECIEKYTSSINYYISEPDTGIYNAMNKGLAKASGVYLLFLNSGDYLHNNDVVKKVTQKLDSGLDIYYGNLNFISKLDTKIMKYPKELKFSYFYNGGYIPHPASFIKKSLFDLVGNYNENFKIISDWDFFVKAICKLDASYTYMDLTITDFDAYGISSDPTLTSLKKEEKKKSLCSNFSSFVDDAEDNLILKRKFSKTKFKQLDILETNKIAKKMNTVWLFLICLLFNKKIN